MPSPAATKASDKTQSCKKLISLLQKDYGKSVPRLKLPVLETMLFAVCLEDNPWDKAEAGYEKLIRSYFDLNEIRVSSVIELERTLADLRRAEWKGLRIRSILRFVFESTYSYDFEKLAKLTLESAQKRLKKIDYLSPFVTSFTLQQVLGSHVVCLDELSHRAAIHLGIVPPDSEIEDAAEFLKGGIKKADAFAFSHLLRCLATDPVRVDRFLDEYEPEDEEFDVLKVAERLAVIKAPKKRKKKKVVKAAPAKAATTGSAAKQKAGAPAKKASSTKVATAKSTSQKKAAPAAASRKKTSAAPKTAKKAATKKQSSAKSKAIKKKK